MENVRGKPKEWCFRKVTIYSLVCCLILNTSLPVALALDVGDMGVNSGVLSTTFGAHTVIDTDHGAIINWNNPDYGPSANDNGLEIERSRGRFIVWEAALRRRRSL